MVTASDRSAVAFSLSGGSAHDAPEGEALPDKAGRCEERVYLLVDRAYEGKRMCAKAVEKGFVQVVPPKRNRKNPWGYDKELYKRRNGIERYFPRLKRFRKIFTGYDKLDALFTGFICFAMAMDAVISMNRL
jgi:transposase